MFIMLQKIYCKASAVCHKYYFHFSSLQCSNLPSIFPSIIIPIQSGESTLTTTFCLVSHVIDSVFTVDPGWNTFTFHNIKRAITLDILLKMTHEIHIFTSYLILNLITLVHEWVFYTERIVDTRIYFATVFHHDRRLNFVLLLQLHAFLIIHI